MELGGDILCAQKLEQPTIPQGHCLLVNIPYMNAMGSIMCREFGPIFMAGPKGDTPNASPEEIVGPNFRPY